MRTCLLLMDWLVAVAWLGRALYWLRGLAQIPDLAAPPSPEPRPGKRPDLSVIVPARNEGQPVHDCLRSLLASESVQIQVIAINDRSTDDTGAWMEEVRQQAAALGQGNTLEILHLETLPAGWMGKTHAMAAGAARASGDWLLFTDGDVSFRPDTLARALEFVETSQTDHLVLYPTLRYAGAGEKMMLSCLHALSIWGVRPWRVGDPQATRDFIGIGAFNLVRRSAFAAVGGWASLRLEVLEDLRMGYLLKRAGYRQRAVFGPGLITLRWAVGAGGTVRNMTKNLFALFRFRLDITAFALACIAGLCLTPVFCIALGWPAVPPLCVLLVALLAIYARYHRLGMPHAGWALTFPLGSIFFLVAIARSMLLTLARDGVVWRGTFYPLAELRENAGPLR